VIFDIEEIKNKLNKLYAKSKPVFIEYRNKAYDYVSESDPIKVIACIYATIFFVTIFIGFTQHKTNNKIVKPCNIYIKEKLGKKNIHGDFYELDHFMSQTNEKCSPEIDNILNKIIEESKYKIYSPIYRSYVNVTNPFSGINGHVGIDVDGGAHANIYSNVTGKVIWIYTGCPDIGFLGSTCGIRAYGTQDWAGNQVVIQTTIKGEYVQFGFYHLNSVNVSIGDIVTPRTLIGTEGSSGNSSGYHLHFEVAKCVIAYCNCIYGLFDPFNYFTNIF
jgi:hypothetical protein